MLYCFDIMTTESAKRSWMKSVVGRAVSFAIVAGVAFCAGLVVAGTPGSSVVEHLPLIGNGLNATPDPSVNLTDFWEAWNALNTNYVITHASTTMPTVQDRIYGAIEGLAASYGDPYTVYFPPEAAAQFNQTIAGTFGGIGMEIEITNNVLTVEAPLKGTPAAEAGIKAGDQIVAINGVSTTGMSSDDAVDAIRGPVGSTVDLSIVRNGSPMDFKIVRETINVPETDDGLDQASGVYYIALYEFTADSAQLFDEAFARFKASGSDKLVIDLRGNPGGYLDSAVDIASHFLPKGATIVTEDFDGNAPNQVSTSLGYDDVPSGTKVVVLIDGGSASASEILAGALQDDHVATLIGMQSFGKGSVQTLIPLDQGTLKVTIARWVTPAGHWIMGTGITPNIIIPIASSTPAFTPDTPQDPQYARAVQFLTTGK
jgi:carboxyl-terminal processing protease